MLPPPKKCEMLEDELGGSGWRRQRRPASAQRRGAMPALPSLQSPTPSWRGVGGRISGGLLLPPLQISRREHGGEGLQLDKGAGRMPWLIRPTRSPKPPTTSIYLFYFILVDPFAAVI